MTETPSGGLRIPALVTRTGVLEYHDADGNTWGELRTPEEVFDDASLASLRSAPVTELHPGTLVTPRTWKSFAIGHAGDDVRRDGEFVAVSVLVQDAAALERVRSKELREVSLGYTCDLDETPGTYEGKSYARIQRGIRYNHVALGPEGWGRAGGDVRLRLDSHSALSDSALSDSQQAHASQHSRLSRAGSSAVNTTGNDTMKNAQQQQRKDGEVMPPEKKDAPDADEGKGEGEMVPKSKYDADLAAMSVKFEAVAAALGDAMKELAELKAMHEKEEAAEGEITEEKVPEAVQDSIASKRLALWETARGVLGKDAALSGKSARDIKRAVIGAVFKSVKMDSLKSDEAVETLFAAATAQHAEVKRADAHKTVAGVLAPTEKQAEEVKRADSAHAHDEDPIEEQRRRLAALSTLSAPANSNTNAHGRA